MLSDQLLTVAPFLKPYLEAWKQTADHLFRDLLWNLVHTAQSMDPKDEDYSEPQWGSVTWGYLNNGTTERNTQAKSRRRREAPTELLASEPTTFNFMELFFIDYPTMFKAVSVTPSQTEILETAHVFLANPDLSVVMKGVTQGATQDTLWDVDTSEREETIEAMLGLLSYLTNPEVYTS